MPNALTIRSYTQDDLATLATLQRERPPSPDEVADTERTLAQTNLAPERDCALSFDGATPVGYAYLTHEPSIARGVLDYGVAPERDDPHVEGALIAEAAARARSAGLTIVHIDVPESNEARRALLTQLGWTHVRTHLHLRRDNTPPADVPLRDGLTTRPARREDAPAIARIQNAAFTGSWGYAPNTAEEVEYRVFDLPSLRPDPVVILEERGEPIAYCWNHRESEDAPGIVGMVGVLPERQSGGLGRIVTRAGIAQLIELGAPRLEITVDSENPPAIRVYESLGFTLDWHSLWYQLATA